MSLLCPKVGQGGICGLANFQRVCVPPQGLEPDVGLLVGAEREASALAASSCPLLCVGGKEEKERAIELRGPPKARGRHSPCAPFPQALLDLRPKPQVPLSQRWGAAPGPGTEPRRPQSGVEALSCVWGESLALRWHRARTGRVGRERSRLPQARVGATGSRGPI